MLPVHFKFVYLIVNGDQHDLSLLVNYISFSSCLCPLLIGLIEYFLS